MIGKFARKSPAKPSVLLVTSDGEFAERARAALSQAGRWQVDLAAASLAAFERQGLPQPLATLLLVDIDPTEPRDLAALERLMRRHARHLRVIVATDRIMGEAVRALLRLQVADWLVKTAGGNELVQACERAFTPDPAGSAPLDAAIYAFLPAAGGVGNTSLAIQSAFLLTGHGRLDGTCLVDLNFQSGALADYLDVAPALQLDEIAPQPERLDEQLFEVMLSRHGSGIAVLAADNALRDFAAISNDTVARLLDLASMKFERVVLDMPRIWLPWTETVLRGCDKVFLTTEMTVPGLRQAQRLMREVERTCGPELDVSVLVNRYRRRLLGGGINALRRKDAAMLFGGRLAGFVSEDYRLVREAIDRGVPLRDIRRRNSIDRDLAQILAVAAA